MAFTENPELVIIAGAVVAAVAVVAVVFRRAGMKMEGPIGKIQIDAPPPPSETTIEGVKARRDIRIGVEADMAKIKNLDGENVDIATRGRTPGK